MLSFICQLANDYEKDHGFRPNVLYLNRNHFHELTSQLAEIRNLGTISRLLGMELVLDTDVTQPHVCWSEIDWQQAVAV